ncbi:MAG TPA: hypothetical protein VFQ35_20360 [Polyangiaceae bacterium]|nr:hypothetical protein [Polyangiaceae bacterium]
MSSHSRTIISALLPTVALALCSACGDNAKTSDSGGAGGAGGQTHDAGRTINVQIGGEELATDGILFPEGSEVTLVDGWEITFEHVLVTVANVTLSENPDRSPSDQSQTGAVVAQVTGPWAVDLHKNGSVAAAGGEGTAIPLFTIANQNKKGNAPFDMTQRYAFSYDIVSASDAATKVNFEDDVEAKAAYQEMVRNGYSVLYVGTATFKGQGCQSTDDTYDFGKIPVTIPFEIGFATPARMINCQNQENEGDAFQGEEFQRGIPIYANRSSVAQVTLHVDHPFYSDVQHEPALHFDQFAAQLVAKPETQRLLTIEDVVGVDPTAFTDAQGAMLPWRACDGSALPATTQMAFDVGSVPFDPSAEPSEALRDYRDYAYYVQSTQGHLNGGEGLCFVQRNYPYPR